MVKEYLLHSFMILVLESSDAKNVTCEFYDTCTLPCDRIGEDFGIKIVKDGHAVDVDCNLVTSG